MRDSPDPDQTPDGQVLFRERLWPAVWVFLSTALVIPASFLVFLPIDTTAGVIVALVLYGAIVATLVATAPVIAVSKHRIAAGRANLPVAFAGAADAFEQQEAVLERGQRLDARAWLVLRGWIGPVVKIPVVDPADPTPYWLVSTRRPAQLVAAIADARSAAPA
ncbi:MAG: hypothetical protein RI885_1793 [Actinomycetota bacterium]|jgi:hypothetical protein